MNFVAAIVRPYKTYEITKGRGPAKVIERDPHATGVPACIRFRKAADLALEHMSDRILNLLSSRIERQLQFLMQHNGKAHSELTRKERRELNELFSLTLGS